MSKEWNIKSISVRPTADEQVDLIVPRNLLDKQVAEKQQRLTREWQKKIERDKKYVRIDFSFSLSFLFLCVFDHFLALV